MKLKISKLNILFLIIILVLIIPQTRQPIQVLLHKGLSYVSSSNIIEKEDRILVKDSNWQLKSDKNYIINFIDSKGKVVFVNFWATWCPPCIAEMPSIQELYSEYKDDVVFLFVTNEDFQIVEKFMTKKKFTFEVFNPINTIPNQLLTKSIPRTFIINKKGEIVVDESGALDWNSKTVRQQLDQLISE
ncbi:TlpA family protein disulfide reductase [Winogradskyella sp. UBA3174]|uniref:TlpA family protein disulfide reductase n=1 Tax=Winogradskyella sp. UBA3174 TaxID=1947785 RepID=UPI0025DBABB3|nr:TlpA disulfide reductase family protein [Winogradskyella sp. UBA3174]|tara:strand:+ start:14444 stop:15007 length:564 start_codon:yes stop_codon:yes gene_type:complete